MSIYYVYAYLREDGTPYYIGKGSGSRAWSKAKGEIQLPKNINNVVIVENNLSEIGAFAIERRLIKWYGRLDLNTGILRNKTDGGDGVVNKICSIETRKKISLAKKGIPRTEATKTKISISSIGRKHSKESIEKMKLRQVSSETKEKISNSTKGKVVSELTRKKISESLKNKKRGSYKT